MVWYPLTCESYHVADDADPSRDRALVASVVRSTVAYKKERLTRELSYGAGIAGVGVMAMSWFALPLIGVLGAQYWWHRRRHPGRVRGALSVFEHPDDVTRIDCERVGFAIARIVVDTKEGVRVALLCDARRVTDVVAAMKRLAPAAEANLLGMARG
jgi:hypothetical protein